MANTSHLKSLSRTVVSAPKCTLCNDFHAETKLYFIQCFIAHRDVQLTLHFNNSKQKHFIVIYSLWIHAHTKEHC